MSVEGSNSGTAAKLISTDTVSVSVRVTAAAAVGYGDDVRWSM